MSTFGVGEGTYLAFELAAVEKRKFELVTSVLLLETGRM